MDTFRCKRCRKSFLTKSLASEFLAKFDWSIIDKAIDCLFLNYSVGHQNTSADYTDEMPVDAWTIMENLTLKLQSSILAMGCINVINGYDDITDFKKNNSKRPARIFEKCRNNFKSVMNSFDITLKNLKSKMKAKISSYQ